MGSELRLLSMLKAEFCSKSRCCLAGSVETGETRTAQDAENKELLSPSRKWNTRITTPRLTEEQQKEERSVHDTLNRQQL